MGCGDSKAPRRDVPAIGYPHSFEVHPRMGFQCITDGNQCNWFHFTQSEHLRRVEEVSALHFEKWTEEGTAELTGPLGLEKKDQEKVIGFVIGRATFEEVEDKDEDESEVPPDQAWGDLWTGQDFITVDWVCHRSVTCENRDGQNECIITATINGTTRVCEVTKTTGAAPSPRDVAAPARQSSNASNDGRAGGGKQHKHKEHHHDSRYEMSKYTVKMFNDEFEVDGSHHAPGDCAARFGGDWTLKAKNPKSKYGADPITIKTHYADCSHVTYIESVEKVPPLGALCAGIPMGLFMHPVEVEKYATHWAYSQLQKPKRRVSVLKALKGNHYQKKGPATDMMNSLEDVVEAPE